jgi:hypothetical protein
MNLVSIVIKSLLLIFTDFLPSNRVWTRGYLVLYFTQSAVSATYDTVEVQRVKYTKKIKLFSTCLETPKQTTDTNTIYHFVYA